MSLPASFQLSLDLSNIAGPIARTALRLGSMAVLRDINRSGSDGITELQLAGLIGRHRVSESMRENFQNIVGRSYQSSISRILRAEQLILEAGAGPTVQNAVTDENPAPLAMVIQMSLLSFTHEQQSLAQVITNIASEMLRESAVDSRQGLDYVSVLGVVTACQQQTTQFPWANFLERVEERISEAVRTGQTRNRNSKKRRLNSAARKEALSSISNRSLPLVILKTLFVHLVSIQDFPEHRNLQLRTNCGISTLVVWCYYVLGLSVNVRVKGIDVNFGDDPLVFVESCRPTQAFASLLDAAGENEILFKLSQAEEDPPIECENRTTARGFARKVMALSGVHESTINWQAYRVVTDCMRLLSVTAPPSELASLKMTSTTSQAQENIYSSAAFLFNMEELDGNPSTEPSGKAEQEQTKLRRRERAKWAQLLLVVISFARVHNLKDCGNLPLSLDAFSELSTENFAISLSGDEFTGKAPGTFDSFDIISRLLLGHQYSKEYVADSALLSSWGWSIFFDSFAAHDPANVRPGLIHLQLGVPSRNGERKARIVDAPADTPVEFGEPLDEHDKTLIAFWPGVSASRLSVTLIGYWGQDAFSAIQVYEWKMNDRKPRKWRLGFRGKQEMCHNFITIDQCPCAAYLPDEDSRQWIDQLVADGSDEQETAFSTADGAEVVNVVQKYPSRPQESSSSPERVFYADLNVRDSADCLLKAWFFFVTAHSAPRWLALDGLEQLKGEDGGFQNILRGRNCCVKCACRFIVPRSLVLL